MSLPMELLNSLFKGNLYRMYKTAHKHRGKSGVKLYLVRILWR